MVDGHSPKDERVREPHGRWIARTAWLALGSLVAGGMLQYVRPLSLPLFADAHYYFLQMVSLLTDGDLDFRNQYAALGDPFRNVQHEVTRGIGNAILWAPFFYLASACASVLGHGGANDPQGAFWLLWGCRSATLFYGACGAALLFANPRLRSQAVWRRALVTAAIVLGTPLWPYAIWLPLYDHVLTFFLVSALWFFAELPVERLRVVSLASPATALTRAAYLRWLAIGAVIGLLITTRPELAAFALMLVTPWSELKPRARGLCLAAVPALVLVGLQLALFRAFAKSELPHPEFLQLRDPRFLSLLFSPRNGFVFQQPIVLLGLLGLLATEWRRARGLALLAAFAFVLWINASAWDPWGGYAFGARRLIPLLPFVGLGLLSVWDALARRVRRVRTLDLSMAALVGLSAYYGSSMLTHARAAAAAVGAPTRESPLQKLVGKATAYPLLARIQMQGAVSLEKAYRIATREVLFRWPAEPRGVTDRMAATSERFHDLKVDQRVIESRLHRVFLLPLHRTQIRVVRVRVAPIGPVLVLWNGALRSPIAGPPSYLSFAVPLQSAAPDSARLEIVTARDAKLLEVLFEGL